MQRLPLILGAALVTAAPAQAVCDPSPGNTPAGAARIYEGSIGDASVRLALVFGKDGGVEGRYAFATSTAEILVKGKIEPGGERFTLIEPGADGQPHATFTGVFANTGIAAPPSGKASPGAVFGPGPLLPGSPANGIPAEAFKANCFILSGARIETGGASQAMKVFRARVVDHPQFGHLYAIAGVADDEIVNRHAQAFRQAVADGRPEEAARHMRLPMTFTVRGKLVVIETAKDLKARFDDIFPQATREGIAKLVPRMMQATEFGIMLQNMWFDSEGYLIAF